MVRFAIDENKCEIAAAGNFIDVELSLLAYGICKNEKTLDLFIKLTEHVQLIMQEKENEYSGKI